MQQQSNNNQAKYRINHQIKASQVRLINSDGTNLGVISLNEALRKAADQQLDLIEINGKTTPIICKITDLGKLKYEDKKKQAEQRKVQRTQELKEIMFRPGTEENDLNHKLAAAKEFLTEGHKVKFTVRFKGREIMHPEVGSDKLSWVLEQVKDLITPLTLNPTMEGKFLSITVLPAKKN